jgi:hypothetical protein
MILLSREGAEGDSARALYVRMGSYMIDPLDSLNAATRRA